MDAAPQIVTHNSGIRCPAESADHFDGVLVLLTLTPTPNGSLNVWSLVPAIRKVAELRLTPRGFDYLISKRLR